LLLPAALVDAVKKVSRDTLYNYAECIATAYAMGSRAIGGKVSLTAGSERYAPESLDTLVWFPPGEPSDTANRLTLPSLGRLTLPR
jgi:hypothetical protein